MTKRKVPTMLSCRSRISYDGPHKVTASSRCDFHKQICLDCCHKFHRIGNEEKKLYDMKGVWVGKEIDDKYEKKCRRIWLKKWKEFKETLANRTPEQIKMADEVLARDGVSYI